MPRFYVGVLIGSNVRASVIGGLQKMSSGGGAGNALAIESTSAAGSASGEIPFEETLGAYGKTLVRAIGLPESTADAMVNSGKVVKAAVTLS